MPFSVTSARDVVEIVVLWAGLLMPLFGLYGYLNVTVTPHFVGDVIGHFIPGLYREECLVEVFLLIQLFNNNPSPNEQIQTKYKKQQTNLSQVLLLLLLLNWVFDFIKRET